MLNFANKYFLKSHLDVEDLSARLQGKVRWGLSKFHLKLL
jgi:hypothetical protein